MKEVILREPVQNVILVNNVDPMKYYGIISQFKVIGFITKIEYWTGEFIAKGFRELTNGNGWAIQNSDLTELIKYLINQEFKVYEFDTWQELLKWASEK